MNPTSQDVKDMLVAETSLALTFATNLFVGLEPIDPDDCVTIFDTPGGPPQLTFDKDETYYYPSVQIRVRNRDYLTGWALINDIKVSLHGRGGETWNGSVYSLISCPNDPGLLYWDERKRVSFVATFNAQRQ